jgi:hypothetical protein
MQIDWNVFFEETNSGNHAKLIPALLFTGADKLQ